MREVVFLKDHLGYRAGSREALHASFAKRCVDIGDAMYLQDYEKAKAEEAEKAEKAAAPAADPSHGHEVGGITGLPPTPETT